MIETIEAKRYHVGRMARRLRHGHRIVMQAIGADIHRELAQTFDASMFARAWLLDGELLALGGVTGTALSSDGMIWLAASEAALAHRTGLARMVLRQLALVLQTKRRVTALILKSDATSLSFAYFLGFRVEKTETVNGAEALVMICER